MNSDDILSKLIEYFIAVEVYVKEDGDESTPLVKKQYIYPETDDQDFFNNISLFAFPSEKTFDISNIHLGKDKNKNNVFKDASKDHYDITEINTTTPKIKKSFLDEIKCHDFILTNEYGEKIYASCLRTTKVPLKWDRNIESNNFNDQYLCEENINKKTSSKIHHMAYTSESTVYSEEFLSDSLSSNHLNLFCPFNEYGFNSLSSSKENFSKSSININNKEGNEKFKVSNKKNKKRDEYI
ncbi:hypothetical protein BCR32DRAFT_304411 [Anaeromyces robustus]|uniref:uDENN domain-containing protein n=1 Tax=Anaeromyces robustus TaxID=1754192 RepID=A0A1Y1XIL9_9FUNG|nr:hypothetical protein BCR32DRAFT_304411 [Anaeromyces robustus]|eukprot:ORX85607.1 hypothetical protein BCR32DRAFT_304411 [Anaeromyces robustus]